MLYVDYCILMQSYRETEKALDELYDRQLELFTRTQPGAIRYDSVKVLHSVSDDSPLDDFVIANEAIEQKIRVVKIIKAERKEMLDQKRAELEESHIPDDRIFVMYYLRGDPATYIGAMVGYSKDAVWDHKRKMEERLARDGISLYELFGRR